jgi:hypothetical protein
LCAVFLLLSSSEGFCFCPINAGYLLFYCLTCLPLAAMNIHTSISLDSIILSLLSSAFWTMPSIPNLMILFFCQELSSPYPQHSIIRGVSFFHLFFFLWNSPYSPYLAASPSLSFLWVCLHLQYSNELHLLCRDLDLFWSIVFEPESLLRNKPFDIFGCKLDRDGIPSCIYFLC